MVLGISKNMFRRGTEQHQSYELIYTIMWQVHILSFLYSNHASVLLHYVMKNFKQSNIFNRFWLSKGLFHHSRLTDGTLHCFKLLKLLSYMRSDNSIVGICACQMLTEWCAIPKGWASLKKSTNNSSLHEKFFKVHTQKNVYFSTNHIKLASVKLRVLCKAQPSWHTAVAM